MKAIMISINKPHTDNIFSGKKTNEWRTRPLPIGKAYVYETKHGGGCGKVIGEMEIVKTYRFHADDLIYQDTLIEQGCVPYNFVANYAKGKEYISANIIVNAKRYNEPKELKEFETPCTCTGQYEGETYSDCLFCDKAGDSDYGIIACDRKLKRPPQSWQRVEEI